MFTSEKTGYLPFVRITDRIYQDAEIEKTYEAYGYGDEFHRMLVLDAIILNTDRHQGNHGKYNFPNERLEVLEKIINKQIDLLIS